MSNYLPFRHDIEGLRALAVLAVLGFHFQWGLSGGFIGVDVFFVISGYFITRNILAEIQGEGFSFKEFFIRRARRLFPALFFTVALTLLVGVLVSSPSVLKHIAVSSITSILSVSNFYFWSQSGYFDAAAIQKPLLHTWALAVQEQFYLVWPVVVLLLARYARSLRTTVALLTILMAIGIWAAERYMSSDPAGAFYLMPFRISEFTIGALCAWIPHRSPRGYTGEVLSILALGLIIYPVFSYSDTTSFPGLSALVPCSGAAMLILFTEGKTSRWLLSNPVAIGIGRISYSLYLAHWPIYVFYRQWKGSILTAPDSLFIVISTFILAIIMYKYIEHPFRARNSSHVTTISTRTFTHLFTGLAAMLAIVSASIWIGNGWSWRYPGVLTHLTQEADAQRNERSNPYRKRCLAKNVQSCDLPAEEGVNVFIVGDSHAPDIFNALVEQYPEFHYVLHNLYGCPPLVREDFNLLTVKHPTRDACIDRNEKLLYGNQLAEADIIVINTMFAWYKPEHLARTIAQIRNMTNAPIVVLGNYLIFDEDFPDLVVKHGIMNMDDFYAKRLSKKTFAFENELESLSKDLEFTYVSKKKLFCDNDSLMSCPIMFDEKLFTYDRHHLSLAAASHLGDELNKSYGGIFKQLENRQHMSTINENNH